MTSAVGDPVIGPSGENLEPWWITGGAADASLYGAWQSMSRPNYAATLVDLSGQGADRDLIPDVYGPAPNWDDVNGWDFSNHASACITTQVNGSRDSTITCRFTDFYSGAMMGTYTSSSASLYIYYYNTTTVIVSMGIHATYGSPFDRNGGVISLVGYPGRKAFYNGSVIKTNIGYNTTVDLGRPVGIGGFPTSIGQDGNVKVQAACWHTTAISDADVVTLHNQILAIT